MGICQALRDIKEGKKIEPRLIRLLLKYSLIKAIDTYITTYSFKQTYTLTEHGERELQLNEQLVRDIK